MNNNGLLFRGSDGQFNSYKVLDSSLVTVGQWGDNDLFKNTDGTLDGSCAYYPFNYIIQNQGPPYSVSAFNKTSNMLWYDSDYVDIFSKDPKIYHRNLGGILLNSLSHTIQLEGVIYMFDGDTNQRTLGQIPSYNTHIINRVTTPNVPQINPFLGIGSFDSSKSYKY